MTSGGAQALENTWFIKQAQETARANENEVSMGLKMSPVTASQAEENMSV